VQLAPPGKLPELEGAAAILTVPVGDEAVPLAVSETVAVHVVVLSATSVLGAHASEVAVERPRTVQVNVVLA
jgi:hypothetical protein